MSFICTPALATVAEEDNVPSTHEFSPPPLKFGILLFRTEGYPNYFLILYSVNICISPIFILQNMSILYNIWVPE